MNEKNEIETIHVSFDVTIPRERSFGEIADILEAMKGAAIAAAVGAGAKACERTAMHSDTFGGRPHP